MPNCFFSVQRVGHRVGPSNVDTARSWRVVAGIVLSYTVINTDCSTIFTNGFIIYSRMRKNITTSTTYTKL